MGAPTLPKLSDVIKSIIMLKQHSAPRKGTVHCTGDQPPVGWNDWRVAMLGRLYTHTRRAFGPHSEKKRPQRDSETRVGQ
jgi:hypothetical protein